MQQKVKQVSENNYSWKNLNKQIKIFKQKLLVNTLNNHTPGVKDKSFITNQDLILKLDELEKILEKKIGINKN